MRSALLDCVGIDAADTLQRLILSFPDIAAVTLASYAHLPMVQDRTDLSVAETAVVHDAIAFRRERQLPFWDCVMLSISKSEDPMDVLLDAAAVHVSLRGTDISLNRDSISRGALQDSIKRISVQTGETCILSEVVLSDGTVRHLPMLDFHCPPTTAGRLAAIAVCKRLFPAGAVLLKSGESFHAYGMNLMSVPEFFEFLGRALLYSPIIDRAYIAHQLIEKRCALRISGTKKPIPTTIDII